MYWRRRRDNADLVKTLRLVECEETRIDNVLNLVDELDWWRPETVAQHCGDEIIMPLVVREIVVLNAVVSLGLGFCSLCLYAPSHLYERSCPSVRP